MLIFAAGVGACRAAMRDVGSGARRPPVAKSGNPALFLVRNPGQEQVRS